MKTRVSVKYFVNDYRIFTLLIITQDLNKIKKSRTPFFKETCAKIQEKILNSVVVGARQSFQFFRKIT